MKKIILAILFILCYSVPSIANTKDELDRINADIVDYFLIASHLQTEIDDLKNEQHEKLLNIVELEQKRKVLLKQV